jgi:hypothetical protein
MKARKKYNKGGKIDPPKGKLSNKQLAMFLRKMIANKTPIDEMGSIASSSINYIGDTDDGDWVGLNNRISKYNDDGSANIGFGKYGDGYNGTGMEWFGVPVKKDWLGGDYIDPITIHPWEDKLEFSNKRFKEQKPMKLVDPFPKVYGRKMDASGTKAIYNTSKGQITKKKGKEDADFVKMMIRLGRNYR